MIDSLNHDVGSMNRSFDCLGGQFTNASPLMSLMVDYHHYLYGSIGSKIGLYLAHFVISFIGPMLSFGIVLYENFGGDRQKRNIMNQLLSGFIITCFVPNTIFSICKLWFDLYGLIDSNTMSFLVAFCYFVFMNAFGYINELTVLRFMYIVKWKRIKVINDQFWFQILFVSNALIALVSTIMICLSSKSILHSSLNIFSRLIQTSKIGDAPEECYTR